MSAILLQALQQLDSNIRGIVIADTEYLATPGELPQPVCLVAKSFPSGEVHRLFFPEKPPYPACPFDLGPSAVFVAFMAAAEFSTLLRLEWPLPARVLDLYIEHLHLGNEASKRRSMAAKGETGLLAACRLAGIPTMTYQQKEEERDFVLQGFPYSAEAAWRILDYCERDVDATMALLDKMAPKILKLHKKNLQAAVHRAEYMKAVAMMEHNGVPLDTELLARLQAHWQGIKERLIARVDEQYYVHQGTRLKFNLLEAYLEEQQITDFARTPTGRLSTSDEALSAAAEVYPQLRPLAQLRSTLGQTRLGIGFPVGRDGRARCSFFPFATVTSRNAPSNKTFIFGASTWMRHLVKPAPGRALIYADWQSQEMWIAAHLSQDQRMLEMLRSGDPYIAFARMANAVPPGATKSSHPELRNQYKTTALGTMYGLSAYGLARRLQISEPAAEALLGKHRDLFPRFWRWLDESVGAAIEQGYMCTPQGWMRQIVPTSACSNGNRKSQLKSLQNHTMQATGAEILRRTCCRALEQGLTVCAPVHDALLLECDAANVEQASTALVETMNHASMAVLGLVIPVEVMPAILYPHRFIPDKAEAASMWAMVCQMLEDVEKGENNERR